MTIVLVFLNIILNVFGQLLLKAGINRIGSFSWQNFLPFFFAAFSSPYVVGGLILYFSSFLVWLILLSKVDLSFAYPTVSLSYVLILITSWLLFHESIPPIRMIGVVFITFGVFLILRS